MTLVLYDGSWMGFLTLVFEVYEYKIAEPSIGKMGSANGSLFGTAHEVMTSEEKAMRVLKKLQQKISLVALRQLRHNFLSELEGIEIVMLGYIQYVLASKYSVENDYGHPCVFAVQENSRKVLREKHRMEAFVRFQLTKDGLYYAIVQPDYNVLPLIAKHFKDRYADQRWLIYDTQRKYGICYDLQTVSEVQLHFSHDMNNETALDNLYDEREPLYQTLWQQYFKTVNIAARKNTKLHVQHMPKRYWKYLVEKQ